MGKKFSEQRFEEWIETSLLNVGYGESFIHNETNDSRYDKELCLIPDEVISFIKSTQEEEYQKLYSQMEESTDGQILKVVNQTIEQRGIIDTLRMGISTRGCSFNLLYFKPKSSLNKEHTELYGKNRFVVVRQLHYSKRNRNSLDMVIFLNGIPIITMELKNQLSGQSVIDSEKQYRRDRDPKEPLFQFKRCLVHFCVDNDKVSMTTKLKGGDTSFLPYNKDIVNPIVPDNYRTHYLWDEILTPDSLLDIIENFVLLDKETSKNWSDKTKRVEETTKYNLIFPRYHQLEVIRELRQEVKKEGVGHNYLIQHTTGSGKSYSIGYLSHTLTSLYRNDGDTKRMFDSILVITDRKVLDKQLQGTISKLEQTGGVVNSVDLNSQQLKEFLEKGKDIIITTIQKFPVISETISQLKSKTFGVIIDEVHSSQSGETSKHLKKSLSKGDEPDTGDDEDEVDYEDMIREEIQSRGKQPHISFFGFTGTPKNKTLELFGRKNESGQFVPFHTYTMRQSIIEGFTLDVLQNYTTYKRYFKVHEKDGKGDVELPEGQVKKELVQYTDSHPETIRQKVSVILHHFVNKTSKKINGVGRGMVVVRSRYHCVLFQQEMVTQMKEMGLPYSCLVAFSGSINHNGRENTESSLNTENGMTGSIPDGFKDPRYRILIVSNKYQTGFDEPMIQSMYVDKKLNGVQCVQTLSRLNRKMTGKEDTFVLDFVNDTELIVNSFQPYYTTTLLTGETDPDKLYDMVYKIEGFNLYTKYQLDEFCKEFYKKNTSDERIHPIIDVVVNTYLEKLTEEQQVEFKSLIQSYIRLYSYISQISSFGEIHWEKTFVFLRFLNKKLPKGKDERISVLDSVNLDSLRIQMIGESNLSLEEKTGELEPISNEGGKGKDETPMELLSEIIKKVNETYGMELKEEDRITIDVVYQKLAQNEDLQKVFLGNNSSDVKKEELKRVFKDEMVDYTNDRMDFYKNVMNPKVLPILIDFLFSQYSQGRML
jgi:type I restriction enzyme R subunit